MIDGFSKMKKKRLLHNWVLVVWGCLKRGEKSFLRPFGFYKSNTVWLLRKKNWRKTERQKKFQMFQSYWFWGLCCHILMSFNHCWCPVFLHFLCVYFFRVICHHWHVSGFNIFCSFLRRVSTTAFCLMWLNPPRTLCQQ